ncbi:MAG TPA: dTDP-4-dehydrorhamnose 3,5-epimerase, partial [Flavisolibacter sp.]
SEDNKKQFYSPAGFAHGFSVLSEIAVVLYKCDGFYNKESEGGIRFDDPDLAIDWQIGKGQEVVSPKDLVLPALKDCSTNFEFRG